MNDDNKKKIEFVNYQAISNSSWIFLFISNGSRICHIKSILFIQFTNFHNNTHMTTWERDIYHKFQIYEKRGHWNELTPLFSLFSLSYLPLFFSFCCLSSSIGDKLRRIQDNRRWFYSFITAGELMNKLRYALI